MEYRGEISEKQDFIQLMNSTYLEAVSEIDFYQKLQKQGLELYSYRGKISGVKGKRKFRFGNLGYTKGHLKKLNKNIDKVQRLTLLKEIRVNQKAKSREN